MNSREYLEKMANIHQNLIEYVDNEDAANAEDYFIKFKDFISTIKIQENKHEFKSFLYLLIKIVNNHHRIDSFINKIERILSLFKEDIKKNFSNFELFHIFKSNKRILLFLFEEKIMIFDESIAKRIIKGKYLDYKYPQYKFNQKLFNLKKKHGFQNIINWSLIFNKKLGNNFINNERLAKMII